MNNTSVISSFAHFYTAHMRKEANFSLQEINEIIDRHLKNTKLSNSDLRKDMMVSHRQLNRIINDLTGKSPRKYLRNYRLEKAMSFLKNGNYQTVKEVGHAVGFINLGYFIFKFRQQYGKTPYEVLKEYGWRK